MEVVLSGMRPSGKLHLGNLYGVLKNWIELQDKYKCYYFVADWHALTTGFNESKAIYDNTLEMIIDWIAFGLDTQKVCIFVQSLVKEHAEFFLLLSMITPVGKLERVPSYKDQILQLGENRTANYGFLGYPVLMSADIMLYNANYVPVGQDQLAHLEFTRELVRSFNGFTQREVFIEPEALLSEFPKILGTDGRKMSKSYNNAIYLADSPEETAQKIKTMFTDTRRKRRTDPGVAKDCGVFMIHEVFTDNQTCNEIEISCAKATIGCSDCKKILIQNLNSALEPIRQKRQHLKEQKDKIIENIIESSKTASISAKETLNSAKEAIFSNYLG